MEAYANKLKDLERLFTDMDGGLKPTNSAEMEAALRATEQLVNNLQDTTDQLTGEMRSDRIRSHQIFNFQYFNIFNIPQWGNLHYYSSKWTVIEYKSSNKKKYKPSIFNSLIIF